MSDDVFEISGELKDYWFFVNTLMELWENKQRKLKKKIFVNILKLEVLHTIATLWMLTHTNETQTTKIRRETPNGIESTDSVSLVGKRF